jgi:gliding motility-associated-like protein
MKQLVACLIMLFICYGRASAQNLLFDQGYTPQQLAETIMDINCEAQVTNATITGYSGPDGTSYAHFVLNYTPINIDDWVITSGIMLTSGYVSNPVQGSGILTLNSNGSTSWPGDAEIGSAINSPVTYNATYLEFDFTSTADYVSFRFFMASEEFYSYIYDINRDCSYNDGVAILIKPAGSTQPYQNLALIPSVQIPVSTFNISAGIHCPEVPDVWQNVGGTYTYDYGYDGGTGTYMVGTAIVPGTAYHIKMGVADGLDPGYDSALIVGAANPDFSINLGFDRLLQFYDPLCPGEDLTVNSKPGAVQYKWYKDDVLIPAEQAMAYTITQPGTYTAVATMPNGCDYTGDITVEYSLPIPPTPVTYYQCDEDGDGYSGYNIPQAGDDVLPEGLQQLYYYHTLADANNDTNRIAVTATPQLYYNLVPDERVYALVQNQYGCRQIIPIILSVTPPVNPVIPPVTGCANVGGPAGMATFNLAQAAIDIAQDFPPGTTARFFLTEAEALLGLTPLPDSYTNTTPGGGVLYVRLSNSQGCYGIGAAHLTIVDFGTGLDDEQVALCNGETIELNAGPGYQSYLWDGDPLQNTQTKTITGPGTYTVAVTNTAGCSRSKAFTVFASQSPQAITLEISDFAGGRNTIAVVTEGDGQYEYSLDGINYQPGSFFENLQMGPYTVYVRDANGCGPGLSADTVILDYPTFFTPNGDGTNDTWRIPYLYFRPDVRVIIFDRYGKFITEIKNTSTGWDGTFEGKPLPANDYWFTTLLENGTSVKGHFSLIR